MNKGVYIIMISQCMCSHAHERIYNDVMEHAHTL